MSKVKWSVTGCALLMSALLATGCSQNAGGPVAPPANSGEGHADDAHPTEGPHGGDLIELGNEEYHAELMHDDGAGTVTIFILDAHAEAAVPIDATELSINLTHDGEAEQFKLAASPDASDPQGKSSRFTSTDAELGEDLEHEDTQSQLVVTINGKQYRGRIEHSHETGHNH